MQDNTALRHRLIMLYRASVATRYDYDAIKHDPQLPMGLDREAVMGLRDFFLENLYAAPEQRAKLDAAFAQLATFIHNPQKVWGLLGNITTALLQFGRYFPVALKAGIATLETHNAARKLENGLLQAALQNGFTENMTDEDFLTCMRTLPVNTLETFIADLGKLFLVIADNTILDKTIAILENILQRMAQKPDVYSQADNDAIQLGLTILLKGKKLLSKQDDKMKRALLEYVSYSELRFIATLHEKKD